MPFREVHSRQCPDVRPCQHQPVKRRQFLRSSKCPEERLEVRPDAVPVHTAEEPDLDAVTVGRSQAKV